MNKKKMIELFLYIAVVVIGIILLLASNSGMSNEQVQKQTEGGSVYAAVSDREFTQPFD